jgi:pyridoxamine 5'-phosphate oxidase-like protein
MAAVPSPTPEPMPWPGYEPDRPGARLLLPWSWAVERLERSRRYWLATADPGGTPHLTAVWAVWIEGGLAFSTGARTRKARDLAGRPRCAISTESAGEAVVIEGLAEATAEPGLVGRIDAAYTAKYGGSPLIGDSPVFVVRPLRASGLVEEDPSSRPTRWRFPAPKE